MASSTRLVIADDHPLFRDALRQAVGAVMTTAKMPRPIHLGFSKNRNMRAEHSRGCG